MPTDIALARHQAFSATTLLILGGGLALYQMTSLILGPTGSRQLELSLSIPALEAADSAEPPTVTGAIIGSLVTPVLLESGPASTQAHRTAPVGRSKTPSMAPAPAVAPPSVVTVPSAPPSLHPEHHPLPVVRIPQPERDDMPDTERD